MDSNGKTALLRGWTVMRMLRLLAGSWFIYVGWRDGEWIYAAAGAFFVLQGLFRWGCASCRDGACAVPRPTSTGRTPPAPEP